MPPDYDARIVDLYDEDNPAGAGEGFVLAFADRLGARRILDLGWGTGALTVRLTGPGRTVCGADPSATMIDYARRRPGAEAVTWIQGDADGVPADPVDLVLMTGNVVQHIADPAWQGTLRALRSRLVPGSRLVFDSRNPSARAWEQWRRERPRTRETIHGPLREWSEVEERGEGLVHARFHNVFERSGAHVVQEETFVFRDLARLTSDLAEAGFEILWVCGDTLGPRSTALRRGCSSRRTLRPERTSAADCRALGAPGFSTSISPPPARPGQSCATARLIARTRSPS